jgi:hypothetical protein
LEPSSPAEDASLAVGWGVAEDVAEGVVGEVCYFGSGGIGGRHDVTVEVGEGVEFFIVGLGFGWTDGK